MVDSFCYLSDMLSTESGADAAITATVMCARKKLWELVPSVTLKPPSLKITNQFYMIELD